MRYKPRSIALLSTLAMLIVGISASAASAAINFEWHVKGAALASGSSKAFTIQNKSPGLFHLKFGFGGQTLEVTASKLKFGSGAAIIGGKPGTSEQTLTLEGVKVEHPSKCAVKEGKITTVPLKSEIVEGAKAGVGKGNTELLFTPKSENEHMIWTDFEIVNNGSEECVFRNSVEQLSGSLLAETSPQKTEATVGQLIFEAKTKEYRNTKNEFKIAGLVYAGNASTLTGEAEIELVSKEVFGAF